MENLNIRRNFETLSQTYKITNSYEAVSIPMDEILLKLGYEYKKEKCTKRNFTMQNVDGDLIVISRMPNEHYLYFNPFNDNDKGNIHSFCKNRGISLKDVLYNNVFELKHKLQYSDSKHKDSASIKAVSEFEKFKGIQDSSFLQKRGIDTLIANAFNIRLDNYNNVCFPHFHVLENPFYKKVFLLQSGYTSKLRNPMIKDSGGKALEPNKFIKSICYGSKGLEILKSNECTHLSQIQNIIITESSIDSLSLFEIKNKGLVKDDNLFSINFENTLLCATGGNKNEAITKVIIYLRDNTQKHTKFILAMDNDEKGQYFNHQIKEILGDRIIIEEQSELKDFNDDLQAIKIIQEGKLNLRLDKKLKESLEYQTCKLIKELQKVSEQKKKQELIQKLETIKILKPFTNIQSKFYKELTSNKTYKYL